MSVMLCITRFIFLDDLHNLAHVQTDLRALLLLVVGDGHVLVEEQRVGCSRVAFSGKQIQTDAG